MSIFWALWIYKHSKGDFLMPFGALMQLAETTNYALFVKNAC